MYNSNLIKTKYIDADKDFNHGLKLKVNQKSLEKVVINNDENDYDDLNVKLPKVNFCESVANSIIDGENKKSSLKLYPQISDLCEDDRQKIGHLITEVLRHKDLQEFKSEEVQNLLQELHMKDQKIVELTQDLSAFKLGCRAKDNDLKFLIDSHKIQENGLKKQILEFQHTIMLMTKEKLNLEIALQRFRKQNECLRNDNKILEQEKKVLEKKCLYLKSKLKKSLKFGNNYNDKNVMKLSENVLVEDVQLEMEKCGNSKLGSIIEEEALKKKEHAHDMKIQELFVNKEDNLLSELFFIPSQQDFPDLQSLSNLYSQ